ncbi:hypothetical protein Q8A67_009924 [Cirrhinus molitorella]|uniref:TNFR-Cys domain-containing protein n=1 Tax=Cirrhinus molitorella TaxID=172907 RepID=A0AA88Q362_9TELE|nr:hypothetical protein Q8A67_009924 [Cirrhinus molitorella]
MCAPGNHVYWHCTADTSTTCVPCPASTYTDEPNGLIKCFSCTVCDTVQHLKVKKACTRFADTICEPQEGFHCIKPNKDSCVLALEHTECKPGQFIKQKGTAFTDTTCADCTDGTYSNGSLMACLQHSTCETMGFIEIKAGTTSSDAECQKVTSVENIKHNALTKVAVTHYDKQLRMMNRNGRISWTYFDKPVLTEGHLGLTVGFPGETEQEGQRWWGFYKLYDMSTTFMRFLFLLFVLRPFGKACGPSEYKSALGECCPMCNVGSVVHSECRGDLSTTCKPCTPGTFISEPNGLHNCFTCRNCVESRGLYIQSKCTTMQDTICDVLDGYHCIDYSVSQCSHAQKHSVCKSGQETKTPGTKTSDTVCVDCPHGFYSLSGLNCTKWTDCSARNEIETEHGSSVKDVTCTPKGRQRYGLTFPIVLTILSCIILYLAPQSTSKYMQDSYHPVEETNPMNTAPPIHNICEEQVVSQESVTSPTGNLV